MCILYRPNIIGLSRCYVSVDLILFWSEIDEEKMLNIKNRMEDDPFSYYYNFDEVTVNVVSENKYEH